MLTKLRLSRLRDIGWKHWDPIGLLADGDTWEGKPFADEYDRYLIHAAGQLQRSVPEDDVIDDLVRIEEKYIGLRTSDTVRERARAVILAIQNDPDLWNRDPVTSSWD